MEHELRKHNYFGFDKRENSLLICKLTFFIRFYYYLGTDVASRGLDFKNVEWILQYDLSS